MNTKKDTKPDIENTTPKTATTIQPPPDKQQLISPPRPQPEQPQPKQPQAEDWRMNREWCLNQALDIVKSLEFEVKDLPDFLDRMYRKIIELADDARK